MSSSLISPVEVPASPDEALRLFWAFERAVLATHLRVAVD